MRRLLLAIFLFCFTHILFSYEVKSKPEYEHYWRELESYPRIKNTGFFAFKNGELLHNVPGWGIWAGGGKDDEMFDLLLPASKLAPDQIFVLYRGDSATGIYSAVKKFDELTFIFSCSRSYSCLNALRLPSPYIVDYKDSSTQRHKNLCTDWRAKKNSLVWRGVSSSNRPEQYSKGIRESIVNTLKDHPKCDVGFSGSGYLTQDKLSNRLSPEEQSRHKILLALDGWGWPGSLSWNIHSGSLIITNSNDWCGYMDVLEEGKHYISANEMNIHEVIDWALTHDKEAREIAQNCKNLAAKEFTPKKMRARLLSLFRKANRRKVEPTFSFNNFQINKESMRVLQYNEEVLRYYIASCFGNLGVPFSIEPSSSGLSLLDVHVNSKGFKRLRDYLFSLDHWTLEAHSGFSDGKSIPMFWQLATNDQGETIIQLHYISSEFTYTEGMPWCANISAN